MAQPKALKSPYGQKAQDLAPKPSGGFFADDLSDFVSPSGPLPDEDIVPPGTAIPGTARGLPEQQPQGMTRSFWTNEQVPAKSPEELKADLKGLGAEVAGGVTASAAGATLGGAMGAGIGAFMGGPLAPATIPAGAELGAALGGFIGGAFGTGAAVNYFRNVFGLEEETDRSMALDVFSSIPNLIAPGAGSTFKEIAKSAAGLKSSARVERAILSALTKEGQDTWAAMRQGLSEKATELGGEKFASDVEKELFADIAEGLSADLGPEGAIKYATEKASGKLDAERAWNDLLSVYGEAPGEKEFVSLARGQKTLQTSPGEILKQLGKDYNQNWKSSISAIRDSGYVENIDMVPVLDKLYALRDNKAFGTKYGRQINSVISQIENSKNLEKSAVFKNISPEDAARTAIRDLDTGKEVSFNELLNPRVKYESPETQLAFSGEGRGALPKLAGKSELSKKDLPPEVISEAQGQPAFQFPQSMRGTRVGVMGGPQDTLRRTPSVEIATEYSPATISQKSEKVGQMGLYAEAVPSAPGLKGAEEVSSGFQTQEAFGLNQKLVEQKTLALNDLIELRQLLDQVEFSAGKMTPEKKAIGDVLSVIRPIEDGALQALAASDDAAVSSLGRQAQISKGKIAAHLADMKKLGKMSRPDVFKYASALETKGPDAAGALERILKDYPESRGAIAATILNNRLSKISSGGVTGLSAGMGDAVLSLAKDSQLMGTLEVLAGDQIPASQIKSIMGNYANAISRATKIQNPTLRGDVSSKAFADMFGSLAQKGISINPMRLIESFSEKNPEIAKRIVTRLLAKEGDVAIDAMVTSAPDVVKTISSLEGLFGRRSRPMISRIVERAERAGITSTLFSPYKSSPAESQQGMNQ